MDSHSFKQLQSLKTQLLESPRSPDQFEFDQLLGEPVDQLIIRPVASLRTFQVRQNKMKRLFYWHACCENSRPNHVFAFSSASVIHSFAKKMQKNGGNLNQAENGLGYFCCNQDSNSAARPAADGIMKKTFFKKIWTKRFHTVKFFFQDRAFLSLLSPQVAKVRLLLLLYLGALTVLDQQRLSFFPFTWYLRRENNN